MAWGKRAPQPNPSLGYKTGFADAYELQKELGRGGNGVVRLARHKTSGRSFAVKSIPKVLTDPNASERKKAGQIPYLKREVEVLLALRGTLNVANLEEVYEDATHVHLVLELCTGGELLARTKSVRQYSERTAASFLRAVLRTVAQCHAKRIIHRDIKPENFLLLSDEDASPIKAVDFGLAVFFDPQQLPVTGLNPEGTPWYLAPECCRAKWYPVSDVWAVGVMACYLLTGAYPFLDRVTPNMPDLVRTLRSICFDDLDMGRKEFAGLSEGAAAFIKFLLVKDPLQRPSASEALQHPFLRGRVEERSAGKPLDQTVVQRIQRFAQNSLFKRTVLEHIAADLLSMHFAPEPSTHGGSVFKDRSIRGGMAVAAALSDRAAAGSREGSTRGGWREGSTRGGGQSALRTAASAALAAVGLDRSVQGGDRSVRGGDRSARGGDRSVRRGDRSTHAGGSVRGAGAALLLQAAASGQLPPLSGRARTASMYLPVATPYSHRLAQLFDQLQLKPGQKIDRQLLQQALHQIGYHLQGSEVEELFDAVDVQHKGEVSRAELAAGLIDWKAFQDTYKDRWLECARRAFAELDPDGRGQLGAAEIAAAFGSHLSPYEVDAAVHQALLEATGAAPGAVGDGGRNPPAAADYGGSADSASAQPIDFDHFLGMLRSASADDLELFDSRLSKHSSRYPSLRGDDLPQVKEHGSSSEAGGCCTIS